MIIKLVEVFENTKFTQEAKRYAMREIFVNPDHVVCLRSEPSYGKLLREGVLPEGIDNRQEFTRVHMSRGQLGLDIIVVGSPSSIEGMFGPSEKKVLRG
jgi:hypothetical protein|tara:strand:- start:895 stop:1191 length:297 start_codon:yes stop_codon:yes gene_type:complete